MGYVLNTESFHIDYKEASDERNDFTFPLKANARSGKL